MLDLKIAGKTAIVTGGSSGIGLACAKALFAEGVNVVIIGRKHLKKAVQDIEDIARKNGLGNKVAGIEADLAKPENIKTLVKTVIREFNQIDILVNCAGAALAGAFYELKDKDFVDPLLLKLLGYIHMVREVTSYMIAQKDGRIVNIIGAAGRTPQATLIPICTTNAALISFTRGISRELAAHNIRINAVSPGPTETERTTLLAQRIAQAKGLSVEEVTVDTIRNIPLGRLAKPAEIAALVMFLVSDLSASITGTEILVDGGQTPGI